MKNFIFQFFDENLLSAWFKDERPQGLSWQSALKGYYTILWQKYKNRLFGFFFLWKWFLVLFEGTRTQKLIWKIPLKGYVWFWKEMKNFIFPFFDENLLSAWFKNERPQGLRCQSAWKGYTIYDKNIKIGCLGFFLLKMVLVLFKGTRTQKLIWKLPLKGYCMILKKNEKFYFSIFWWKSVVGMI